MTLCYLLPATIVKRYLSFHDILKLKTLFVKAPTCNLELNTFIAVWVAT